MKSIILLYMINSRVLDNIHRGKWVYSFVLLLNLNFWELEQSYEFSIHLELSRIAYRYLIDE